MDFREVKERFVVLKNPPTAEDFRKKGYHSAIPVIHDGKGYFIVFRNETESRIFTYLHSPHNHRSKERIFGVSIKEGYAYVTKKGIPSSIQLVLPTKWTIEDSKVKRELEVVITDIDQNNNQLLHELYKRTREKK